LAKLKVWNGRVFHRVRGYPNGIPALVCATSQAKAAEVVGESLHEFRKWWTLTPREDYIAAARQQPETLLVPKLLVEWVPVDKHEPPPTIS